MNHWPFIIISYALTLGAAAVVALASYRAMRRAERRADELGDRR